MSAGSSVHSTGTPHTRYDQTALKTEICLTVAQGKECKFGLRCRFAHGLADLRPRLVGDPDQYKVRPCKSFKNGTGCPFRVRCRYLHDEQLLKVNDNVWWLVSTQEDVARFIVIHEGKKFVATAPMGIIPKGAMFYAFGSSYPTPVPAYYDAEPAAGG